VEKPVFGEIVEIPAEKKKTGITDIPRYYRFSEIPVKIPPEILQKNL
jgi:hypothetical protein